MESRGIYMSPDVADAPRSTATACWRSTTASAEVVKDWRRSVRAEDAALFEPFARRIQQFQDFRRELVRRGIEVSPAAGREWGDNDANRTVRKALNDDHRGARRALRRRARSASMRQIDDGIDRDGLADDAAGGCRGAAGRLPARSIIWRAVARPLARDHQRHRSGRRRDAGRSMPYGERGDEIGALARSIAVFQDAMRRNEELNRTVIDDAQARARRQEAMSAEIARLRRRRRVDAGRARPPFPTRCSRRRRSSPSAADNASHRTTGAATASADASANVRDIASAADELAASVAEIDRQVAQSNAIAAKAVSEAEWTNATVKELNEAAGRIGDVVKLITDIAEQTNLLGAQRHHRGGARRRRRPRLCGGGERGQGAGRPDRARRPRTSRAQIAGMQNATMRSIDAIGAIERTIREIGEISRRDRGRGHRAGRRHAGDRAQRRDRGEAHDRNRGRGRARGRGHRCDARQRGRGHDRRRRSRRCGDADPRSGGRFLPEAEGSIAVRLNARPQASDDLKPSMCAGLSSVAAGLRRLAAKQRRTMRLREFRASHPAFGHTKPCDLIARVMRKFRPLPRTRRHVAEIVPMELLGSWVSPRANSPACPLLLVNRSTCETFRAEQSAERALTACEPWNSKFQIFKSPKNRGNCGPCAKEYRHYGVFASKAAGIWRGNRPGATRMASKRMSRMLSIGIVRQPGFGGADNARALAFRDRPRGVVKTLARLDLDEHEQMTPPGNDVDLAEPAPEAARENAEALRDQKGRRPAFGREAEPEGDLPLGVRRALQRGGGFIAIPSQAQARAGRYRGADGRSPRRSRRPLP